MKRIHRLCRTWMVLTVMLILTACRETRQEEKVIQQELQLWYYWDDSEARQSLLQLVDEFNMLHSDVDIVPRYVPDEDFKKTLALAAADNEMPDLAIVDSSDVQYYDAMGALKDTSEYVAEDIYMEAALASCREVDGSYVGLPLGLNCLVFYYNTDILEKAGIAVPQNLDEFAEAAEAVSSDQVSGCAFPSMQSEESMFCFLPILWAKGGSIQNVNAPQSQEAFDFLRRLVDSGAMSKSSVNMTLTDITREFAKGNIAMMFSTSGRERMIRQSNPDLNFEVAEIPNGAQSISVIGGEVLTVTSSEHIEESMQFVAFMADPNRIRDYIMEVGELSPRTDILQWQIGQDPELKQYAEYLDHARLRDFTPYWPSVSMAVSEVINEMILQTDQPDILDQLDVEIRKIQERWEDQDEG